MAMLAVGILSLSKAFIDYATSGLENPLTYVILAGFLLVYLKRPPTVRRFFWLSLLTALGMLNRLDIGLLMLPALGFAFLEVRGRKALAMGALGFLPLVAWELFALLYYGSPVPNTAMAKLNAGLIRPAAIYHEGLMYLLNSLKVDPITLVVIGLAIVLPIAAGGPAQAAAGGRCAALRPVRSPRGWGLHERALSRRPAAAGCRDRGDDAVATVEDLWGFGPSKLELEPQRS